MYLLYFLIVSSLTYLAYWYDKQSAKSGGWRVSENTLHALSLIGGSPVAFIAQRSLRHKTKKFSFQFAYWLIVVLQVLIICGIYFLK